MKKQKRNYRVACYLNRALQIAFIIAFWLVGEFAVRLSHLPVPGGIAGLFILLSFLSSGWISVIRLQHGANLFLAEMLLFFVPATLVVLDHREFMGWVGLRILAVILLSTVTVMGVTAITVDLCFVWLENSRKTIDSQK